jgi:hypothetical protein
MSHLIHVVNSGGQPHVMLVREILLVNFDMKGGEAGGERGRCENGT